MRLKFSLLCIAMFGFAGPIDGEYLVKDSTKTHIAALSISQRSPSSFMFSISALTNKGNTCEPITGITKKIGNNIWQYYGKLNSTDDFYIQMDFKILGDSVIVTTENSYTYCGNGARYDHTFVKSKRQIFDESRPELSNSEYVVIKKSSSEYAIAESELSKAYKKLMSSLTFQQKQELREEQRLWIKMRDEQAFQVGPKTSNEYDYRLIELTKERVEYLKSIAR